MSVMSLFFSYSTGATRGVHAVFRSWKARALIAPPPPPPCVAVVNIEGDDVITKYRLSLHFMEPVEMTACCQISNEV